MRLGPDAEDYTAAPSEGDGRGLDPGGVIRVAGSRQCMYACVHVFLISYYTFMSVNASSK